MGMGQMGQVWSPEESISRLKNSLTFPQKRGLREYGGSLA